MGRGREMSPRTHLCKPLHVTDVSAGWKAIYSPYWHKVAFVRDEAWERLANGEHHFLPQEVVEYLSENHILVDDGFEEHWLRDNLQAAGHQVKFDSMYLVTTQSCNLTCGYCAVMQNFDKPSRARERMSIRTGLSAVEFFERHLQHSQPPEARVTFYGGEPMLNQEVMVALVPRIKGIRYPNQHRLVDVVMITNGYLYDPDLTRLFAKHRVGVCVSLDGKKRHQDVTRLASGSGASTFDRAIDHYRRYQSAGLSTGISTALGRHNVYDLREICEFYATELEAPIVEFQIPYQVAGESNDFWISTVDAARHLMGAYEALRSHDIVEATTYRRLRDFELGTIHYRDCGASGSQLVVAPDGSIGPCHSLVGSRAFFSGSVMDPDCDATTMDNFQEWASRFPLNMPICRDCPYISLCGGGCVYNSYVSTGVIWNKDPQVCPYMRELVDWILRELWITTGMAAKHGGKTPAPQADTGGGSAVA
jgi:uncharacterized protein